MKTAPALNQGGRKGNSSHRVGPRGEGNKQGTYVDLWFCTSPWTSSPFGLTINMRLSGRPTCLYAYTSCRGGTARCESGRKEPPPAQPQSPDPPTHSGSVPKSRVEGQLRGKQVLDIGQAGNLEHLRLLLNHLPGAQGMCTEERSEQHLQGRTACSQALWGLKEGTGKAEGFLCIARASPQSSRRTGSSPAASHEQHPTPRRALEGCSSPQG